jgi:phosphoglycerate dehydrogenase-like enzyme
LAGPAALAYLANFMSLTIWCNGLFSPTATARLEQGLKGHRLLRSAKASASVLEAGQPDPTLAEADIAFGQPDPASCQRFERLRWVEVTTAGYTRYDNEAFRSAFRQREAAFTNASSVFAEPCAQHVLAMMLAVSRQLLPSFRDQLTDQRWEYFQRRYDSQLLVGQTAVILGYGAIGRRLVELLAPFRMKVYAYRRRPLPEEGVASVGREDLAAAVAQADHVINLLPDNPDSRGFVDAEFLAGCKRGARFYNIGRGSTVDQAALVASLRSEHLGAAYLDVTDPEPLPPEHALWRAPNCFITPHTGGGRRDQDEALVAHFLENLRRWQVGKPLVDRVL